MNVLIKRLGCAFQSGRDILDILYWEDRSEHPIIFIPGAWSMPGQMNRLARSVQEVFGHTVICCELSGHNPKVFGHPNDLHGMSLHRHVDDILALLRKVGPAYLVGHSMGAVIARLCASLDGANSVAGIININSWPIEAGVKTLFHSRFVRPCYVWALTTGRAYRLHAQDVLFLANGNQIDFGFESGSTSRQLFLRRDACRLLARPERLPRQFFIQAKNDNLISTACGAKTALPYAGEHDLFTTVNGSYMVHCGVDSSYQELSRVIGNTLHQFEDSQRA
jgi:pimeloyl-ACP methyl ester carboxylesterase